MFACIEFKFLLILQELQQATKLLKHCPPMKYLWETRETSNFFKFRRVGPARWWHDAMPPLIRIARDFSRLLAGST